MIASWVFSKNLPFRRGVMQLLFLLVGFAVGLEVNCGSKILKSGDHMVKCTIFPYVISGYFPIGRNCSSIVFGVCCGIHDAPLCTLLCDL